jgi:hypothetical protein
MKTIKTGKSNQRRRGFQNKKCKVAEKKDKNEDEEEEKESESERNGKIMTCCCCCCLLRHYVRGRM